MTGKEANTIKNIAHTTEFENVTVIDTSPEFTEYRQLDLSREGTVTYQFYGLGENILVYMNVGYGLTDSQSNLSGLSVDLISGGVACKKQFPGHSSWLSFCISIYAIYMFPELSVPCCST